MQGKCFGKFSSSAPECQYCLIKSDCKELTETGSTCFGNFEFGVDKCEKCEKKQDCKSFVMDIELSKMLKHVDY